MSSTLIFFLPENIHLWTEQDCSGCRDPVQPLWFMPNIHVLPQVSKYQVGHGQMSHIKQEATIK